MEVTAKLRFSARRTLFVFAFPTLLPSVASAVVAPGEITITEVMANPAAVSDTQGEWFEIYNHSGNELELTGLVLRDEGSNRHTITDALTLAADSYLVFGRNGDASSNGGYSADYIYNSFTLSNSSDAIILEFDDIIVASLSYDGGVFGQAGVSAELTGNGFMVTPQTYVYGDGDIGTPGTAGSDPALQFEQPPEVPIPAAGWLMASAITVLLGLRRRVSQTLSS